MADKTKLLHIIKGEDYTEDDINCCIVLCDCGRNDLRPVMLKLLLLLSVAVGLILAAFTLRFSTFTGNTEFVTQGDMIVVPATTYFCNGISVQADGMDNKQTITLHVLPKLPSISAERDTYSIAKRFSVSSWTYQYWPFKLLKGTILRIGVCADQYINMYLLKSKKHFDEWTQQILFSKFYLSISVFPRPNCETSREYLYKDVYISKSDDYFVMFSSSVGFRFLTSISVSIDFNRTKWDTNQSLATCTSSLGDTCHVPLRYSSQEVTVIDVMATGSRAHPDVFQKLTIKWFPTPRQWFYWTFFGSVFGTFISLTILYSIWRLCYHRFHVEKEETQPLMTYISTLPTRKSSRLLRSRRLSRFSFPSISEMDEDTDEMRNRDRGSFDYIVESTEEAYDHPNENINTGAAFYRQASMNETYNAGQNYQGTQQLVDSCMTSASVSAI